MTIAKIPVVQAAPKVPTDTSTFRRALNRFALNDRQEDGRRIVDPRIVRLFQKTKQASGYLCPSWIRSRNDLLAAAAKIPESEITELEARNTGHQHQQMQTPRFEAAALQEVVSTIEPTVTSAHKEGKTTDEPNSRYLHNNQ